jgi:hypothetical protein
MRAQALSIALLLFGMTMTGCIAGDEMPPLVNEEEWIDDETPPLTTEKEWIDDDSELLVLEEAGICGDLDGDGELDCPLSGYVPGTTPWWCNSSGIGGHHVDPAYEGLEKGPLSDEHCENLTAEFQDAIEWASQWPTLGEAEAAGFDMIVGYTKGMGTHHAMMGEFNMSNEGFDPDAPSFPGTPLDSEFNHSRPEFLMFAGEEEDSELVGFAWYVQGPTGTPPDGFTGDNDWWHRHESLCFRIEEMIVVGEDLDGEKCSNRGGENVALGEYWMVHAWIVRPWLTHDDVFTNHHPCLTSEGSMDDPEEECWDESTGHVGHDIE